MVKVRTTCAVVTAFNVLKDPVKGWGDGSVLKHSYTLHEFILRTHVNARWAWWPQKTGVGDPRSKLAGEKTSLITELWV